ncbi:Type I transmembrane sorting receptor, partial [Boothiomyces sp. JEL0866]
MNTFVLSLIASCVARDAVTLPMVRKSKSTIESSMSRIAKFNARTNVFTNTQLTNEGDALYVCPVQVAHQLLYLDLDTGSSDTWVFGSNCTNPNNDGSCNATKVDLADPSISKIEGAPQFQIIYGLGNVTGDIYMANVSIGGDGATFPVGVASIANDMGGSDGLMGLAFNSLSSMAYELNHTELPPFPNHNTNFFDQLKFPKEQNMFSFYLSNSHDNDTGEVTFGGYDKSKFTGDIHWVDVVEL